MNHNFTMNHTRRLLQYHRSSLASSSSSASINQFSLSINHSANAYLIFGANTDVGKTVISAGLVQASLRASNERVNYIKPLQCGGSDASFIQKHCGNNIPNLQTKTLFTWDTPASPHVASLRESRPISDDQVLSALQTELHDCALPSTTTWLETAGGVLSPSAASPDNNLIHHALFPASSSSCWGWQTQADLYKPLGNLIPVVLCGDGRLGGISATLSSLESLLLRGYNVVGIVMLETGYDNVSAVRSYAGRKVKLLSSNEHVLFHDPERSIVSLPQLPPQPEPLHDWYQSEQVLDTLDSFHTFLSDRWRVSNDL